MSSPQQVVLITGASSGFGRLFAETLARKNYQVFATMRNVNGGNAAVAREIAELAERESLSLQTPGSHPAGPSIPVHPYSG